MKVANKIETNNLSRSSIAGKIKPNGIQASASNEKSAEVVITNAKDGKQTGIVKRTGVSINPTPKNEAQIKVIPKGGDSISGVVRVATTNHVGTPQQRVVQKLGNTTVKSVQNTTRTAVKAQPKSVPIVPTQTHAHVQARQQPVSILLLLSFAIITIHSRFFFNIQSFYKFAIKTGAPIDCSEFTTGCC